MSAINENFETYLKDVLQSLKPSLILQKIVIHILIFVRRMSGKITEIPTINDKKCIQIHKQLIMYYNNIHKAIKKSRNEFKIVTST